MRGNTNNFDALRLIAAMMVVLSHMASLSGRDEWLVWGRTYGTIGVLAFFSISGYLVTASWRNDPDLGRFLAKRFLRIAPGLMVVAPLTFLLVSALGLYGFPNNPYHTLNGSLWTIEYEVHCYLILAGLMLSTRHPALAGAALCLLGVVVWPKHPLVEFAPFFVMGAALHEYPIMRRWSWVLVALGLATLPYRPILALALIVPPLAIWIGSRSWPILREGGRFGDLSYGVYIYAFPVQQVVVAYMGMSASYWSLLFVTLAALLPLAYGSWRWVEQPALARKPLREPASLRVSEDAGVG
jgi:peptidoglycan/LPS O-acetylase OafA/YrhL